MFFSTVVCCNPCRRSRTSMSPTAYAENVKTFLRNLAYIKGNSSGAVPAAVDEVGGIVGWEVSSEVGSGAVVRALQSGP